MPDIQRLPWKSYFYLSLEWSASVMSFLFMTIVYRLSSAVEIGTNAWLLNFITSSLFISVAVQYYAMLYKRDAVRSYLSFLPLALIEIALIRPFLSMKQWEIVAVIILFNLFYQSFRGGKMGQGKLIFAAMLNFCEQIVRLLLLLVATAIFRFSVTDALFGSIGITYLISGLLSFTAWMMKERTPARFDGLKESSKYVLFYLGIYVLTSIDLLALRGEEELQSHMAILRPWGLILFTLSVPMINLYLSKLQKGESTKPVIWGICLIYAGYFSLCMSASGWLNELLFGKQLLSKINLLFILVEYVCLSLLVACFHHVLHQKIHFKTTVFVSAACSTMILCASRIPWETGVYFCYAATFFLACIYMVYVVKSRSSAWK